jgi:predicted amidohydrolase
MYRKSRLIWAAVVVGLTGLAGAEGAASAGLAAPAADRAPSPARSVRIAGIVLKWIRGDKEANFHRAETMIREAAAHSAQIVCTTECFLDGYAIKDKSIPLEVYRALGEPIPDGPYCRRLAALAGQLRIYLVAGMLEDAGEARYNAAVLIGPDGKLIGKYHKQELGHELVRNTPGKVSEVFETPFGRTGIMICADRTRPDIVRRFCQQGAQFLLCPSGGMFGPRQNDPIVQSRSRENKVSIIFVHPAEFLVTVPDGSIRDCTILGNQLEITPEGRGGQQDQNRVFYFDLPLVSQDVQGSSAFGTAGPQVGLGSTSIRPKAIHLPCRNLW